MADNERERFIELTQGRVSWARLHEGEKRPSYTSVDYELEAPSIPNVGAHPLGQTVAFDIDVKQGAASADEQESWLEEKLGFDFSEALKVLTPSGGRHIYMTWPEEVPLPGNWAFAALLPPKGETTHPLSGDLRVSHKNGHCVAPGSTFEGKTYKIWQEGGFPLQDEAACYGFLSLHKSFHDKQVTSSSRREESGTHLTQVRAAIFEQVQEEKLERLASMLKKKRTRRWHAKRASVYAALSCCYSPEVIAAYWQRLDLGLDTSSNSHIALHQLARDFRGLEASNVHGSYCDFGKDVTAAKTREFRELSPEEWNRKLLSRMKTSTRWREATVLNYKAVVEALTGRKKPTAAHGLALNIVEDIIQPWYNFGVTQVMLSNAFLQDFYGCSPKEVELAKEVLLRKKILRVSKKQGPGRTSVFKVEERFKDRKLSRLLYAMKTVNGCEVAVDSRSGVFYVPDSGRVLLSLSEKACKNFLPEEEFAAKRPAPSLHQYLSGGVVQGDQATVISEASFGKMYGSEESVDV